jgi:hypothetical protein
MKKTAMLIITALVLMVSSCATSGSSIIWRPDGGPLATISLETEKDANLYGAIRYVSGQYQANPWYLYKEPKSKFAQPELMGRDESANTVTLDAAAYDLELDLYKVGGLIGKSGWMDLRMPFHLNKLEEDGEYALVLSKNLPLKGRPDNAVGTLSLYKAGFMESLVQRWFLIGIPEKGGENKLIKKYKSYELLEDTGRSRF